MKNGRVLAIIYHLARTYIFTIERSYSSQILALLGSKERSNGIMSFLPSRYDGRFSLEMESFTFLKHKSSVSGEDWIDADVVET